MTELHVMVFYRSDETIAGELRAAWLHEMFPHVVVHAPFSEHRDPYDPQDDAGWDAWTNEIRRAYDGTFDRVYSLQTYGDELARFLGATHIMVDRLPFSISGTRVRENPGACRNFMSPPVRE